MATHADFIVIGGGSGGLATARKAARYGAKVVLIEGSRLGGTCVNLGCVPKKVMWNAAHILEGIRLAPDYGFEVNATDNWGFLKTRRDQYITRLNGIYQSNLTKDKIEHVTGWAKFVNPNTISVDDAREITGTHILIATGSKTLFPDIPGKELLLSSDDFFYLEEKPRNALIVGSGYIAVEIAGVFNAFGVSTSLACRTEKILRDFDQELADALKEQLIKDGINIIVNRSLVEVRKTDAGVVAVFNNGETAEYEKIFCAIGRDANVQGLNLEASGVQLNAHGMIEVDEFENTNVNNIYALGDVTGKMMLTPVAIAAGRKLAERIFGHHPYCKLDYSNIPTVIFSHPPFGSVGLTEAQARAQYGDGIRVYKTRFTNMFFSLSEHKEVTMMKLIVLGPEERVMGLHAIGRGVDEMIQGFAVAVKMGATKRDFDNCVAIHPTASEEFVTMV